MGSEMCIRDRANPFKKGWKYLMSLFDSKIEEHADPKVQIQQAMEESQRQHRDLSQQAASVIGNQRQLEMQLNRQLGEVEKLHGNTKQALKLADQARAQGDEKKAAEYESAGESFAAQLVTAEQNVENTKQLHDQALKQAEQAKAAVERNAQKLQEQVNERSQLLSKLEQAKMQEKVAESVQSMNRMSDGATPNLDQVRDKIERRYANALGEAELAENSVEGRMQEVEAAGRQMAGHSRLEQIRQELDGGKSQQQAEQKQVTSSSNSGELPGGVDRAAVEQRMKELRGE